jgi:metal-responsive CopG/Arc/MetJ family transcriptional regulator
MASTLIAVRVPDELVGQLDDLATRQGANRSQMIRTLIAEAVAGGDDEPTRAVIVARLDAALSGLAHLAPQDEGDPMG